jgi:hypothetical protein
VRSCRSVVLISSIFDTHTVKLQFLHTSASTCT